jgi:heme-degrading monooxygenase HmoA
MYLHLELKTVPADSRTAAVERLAQLHSLMAAAPGFVDAQICAGLDESSRYLVARAWHSREAHTAYRASPAQQEYAHNRPSSLPWENLAVQEWQALLLVDANERRGAFVVRSLWEVAAGAWDAFLDQLRHRDGARISTRAFRALDGNDLAAGESLVLERYDGRDRNDWGGERTSLEARGATLWERYQVVIETLPA